MIKVEISLGFHLLDPAVNGCFSWSVKPYFLCLLEEHAEEMLHGSRTNFFEKVDEYA